MHCVFCVLPFGLSASAGTFCRFSAVAADVIRRRSRTTALIAYIDDFGGGLGREATHEDAQAVIDTISELG